MAANGISTLATKELRQKAKLDLVALKRQGNVLNSDGAVYSTLLGSAQFNGSNYLSVAGGAGTAMGTGDFTWECWVYPTSSSDYQCFIDTRTQPLAGGDNTGFFFGTNFNTLAPIYYTTNLQLASTESMTLNAWNHVALTRNSGTVTLWVNGASGGTQSNTTNLTEQRVFIGGDGLSTALNLTGNISNLRIVKGQALYTNNFTPPTTTLTAVAGTQLLLLNGTTEFVDGSSNQFTITNSGGVTLSTTAPTLTPSTPAYRTRATYDLTLLPTQYNDNAVINNPNAGGLVVGRPWIETVSTFTFYEAFGTTTALETTQYVSGNKIYAYASTYDVPSFNPARVVVNDIEVLLQGDDPLPYGRGHNIVVLDSYGDVVVPATQLDTYIDPANLTTLASALGAVPSGNIVVLVVYDASALDAGVRSAINTGYGSTNTETWTAQRQSHLFIGVKI
jgi:hypothetical protein